MKCLNCGIDLDCDNKLLCEDCRNKNTTSKDSEGVLREDKKCKLCGKNIYVGGHGFCIYCDLIYDASTITPPTPTVEEVHKNKTAKIEELEERDAADRLAIVNSLWMFGKILLGLFIVFVMFRGRKK